MGSREIRFPVAVHVGDIEIGHRRQFERVVRAEPLGRTGQDVYLAARVVAIGHQEIESSVTCSHPPRAS